MELLTAAGTAASKVNEVILDLETVGTDVRPRDLVEAGVFDVNDSAAIEADEVVVPVNLGVKAGGGAGVAGFRDQAK